MTDRERILTHIIWVVMHYSEEIHLTFLSNYAEFKKGDIIFANTSFEPHNFLVSYFDHYDTERHCYVVKDLVTGKLCDYRNERFTKIKTEWLNEYELLTGKKYKITLSVTQRSRPQL